MGICAPTGRQSAGTHNGAIPYRGFFETAYSALHYLQFGPPHYKDYWDRVLFAATYTNINYEKPLEGSPFILFAG
jgi:hypothetical protein